jgi:hypothetical protein
MPIETICQTCARKLRVADEFAGKKARCPQCGTIYIVPGSPAASSGALPDTVYQRKPADDYWQVRTPDGRVYGPVSRQELDEWVAEGRIPAEASLQTESAPFWRPAVETYPQLRTLSGLQAATNPFTDAPLDSPFAGREVTGRRPHRGVVILILAILPLVTCCPIFGPMAWAMGHTDLREMRMGLMDASGMGLTQAGMVLGIIETVLALLGLGLMFLGGVG